MQVINLLRARWQTWVSAAILAFATLVYLVNTRHSSLLQWDDAYITFRFAQHLTQGYGLVWNVGGERVEGFTSLLQVLLLTLPIKFMLMPEWASLVIGMVSVLLTVGMIAFILRREFGKIVPAAAVVLGLYLIDQVTAIHSTSGLETQLFAATLCAALLLAWSFVETPCWQTAMGLSIILFLSTLTRPEAVLYAAMSYGVLGVYSLFWLRYSRSPDPIKDVILSVGLLVVLGTIYALWKYNYFGYLLPNPFYVKSNQVELAGLEPVMGFLRHIALWYLPITLGFVLLAGQSLLNLLGNIKTITKIGLVVLTPMPALIYYLTITHEVGGSYRFSYPTYFYFVLAAAVSVSAAARALQAKPNYSSVLFSLAAVYLFIPIIVQGSWHLTPLPRDAFMQYHWKIALALKETGLGSNATILTDAAGVIPYVSEFNQLDRVGLTNNFLSGRYKLTPQEREQYLWSRPIDIYVGAEPPAQMGAERPEDDPLMRTPYVHHLLTRKLTLVEDRIFVQDPTLFHARMRELRDHWILLGAINWAGYDAWGLESFVYIRRDSPYLETLKTSLNKIIDIKPSPADWNLGG